MKAGLRFLAPARAKKERDEELALFRELFKREREKNMNLLEAVSTELEPVEGNSVVFKIPTRKKGGFSGKDSEKNDYNWLKTPPATPLFQSLEMDVAQPNNPNMIGHRELYIIPALPPLKPSRFSEKKQEPRARLLTPSSPSIASLVSASSPRFHTADLDPLSPPKAFTTPITTPRFGGAQRPVKESIKPLRTPRFSRKNEETKPRPKSPGSVSVASASSRPETPNVIPKPPSLRRGTTMVLVKGDLNSVEKTTNEGPARQRPTPKLQAPEHKLDVIKLRSTSPTSRSATSKSRPETSSSNLKPKSKGVLKPLERPVKEINKEEAAKIKHESKAKGRSVSPLVGSRFPATLPGFPDEAPPNLITSVAPGRATSAARSRPGVAAMGSAEQRRSPSVTSGRRPTMDAAGEQKGNVKRGGNNGGVVIGSSMVDRMLNARRSTAAGKVAVRDEKVSKMRAM